MCRDHHVAEIFVDHSSALKQEGSTTKAIEVQDSHDARNNTELKISELKAQQYTRPNEAKEVATRPKLIARTPAAAWLMITTHTNTTQKGGSFSEFLCGLPITVGLVCLRAWGAEAGIWTRRWGRQEGKCGAWPVIQGGRLPATKRNDTRKKAQRLQWYQGALIPARDWRETR